VKEFNYIPLNGRVCMVFEGATPNSGFVSNFLKFDVYFYKK